MENKGNKGICNGDWSAIAKSGVNTLWEVVTKEGATHEVVTTSLLGEEIILEVDEEQV